jgi:GNAT superfamily N-acetyltransferase
MAHLRLAAFGAEHNDAGLCRTLMREYAAFLNESVGGQHICVETLDKELAALPGDYSEPDGAILLAFEGDEPAGCVALKPLADPAHPGNLLCEMKRLWVRPAGQGRGVGRALAEGIVSQARARGYTAMVLDTMPASMSAAYRIYCRMGFVPIERYHQNPALRRPDELRIAYLRLEL